MTTLIQLVAILTAMNLCLCVGFVAGFRKAERLAGKELP